MELAAADWQYDSPRRQTMQVVPALTARAFRPLVSGLRALGQNPVALLAEVGVDIATLDNPDAHIPMAAGVGLLARAAVAMGMTASVCTWPSTQTCVPSTSTTTR